MGRSAGAAAAVADGWAAAGGAPTWSRRREALRCIAYRPHLVRTALTAAVVGLVLFAINHLDAVLRGTASTSTWVATGVSFLVPFVVANTGLLIARRRPRGAPSEAAGTSPGTGGAAPVAPGAALGAGWTLAADIPRCLLHRRHLARTAATAAVVGSVYFCVNQLGTVLAGDASLSTWVAGGSTYLVPFCVANLGVLVGTRRSQPSVSS